MDEQLDSLNPVRVRGRIQLYDINQCNHGELLALRGDIVPHSVSPKDLMVLSD